MIRHIVLFKWKADATNEQVGRVASELAVLSKTLPGIRAYHFGEDAGIGAAGNADFALTADFDDADAYLVYRNHPAHLEVLEKTINPILERRVAAQVEI
jgi:ribonucleotide monophosphatase NagD (HAD superfamily)